MRTAADDRRVKKQEPVSIYEIVSSDQMRGLEWLEALSSRSASGQAAYEVAEYVMKLRTAAPHPGHPLIPHTGKCLLNLHCGPAGTAPSRAQQPEQSVPGDPSVKGRPNCETGNQWTGTTGHHREPERQPHGSHARNTGERPPPQPDPATT